MIKKIIFIPALLLVLGAGCTTNSNVTVPPERKTQKLNCANFEYSEWSVCSSGGTQERILVKALPEGCIGGNPVLTQNCKFIPESTPNGQLDVSALTPQTLNKIAQKIKSSPNATCGNAPCIKLSYDSGVANVIMIYELSTDPLEPGSKEALILEINTNTYLDENGRTLSQNEIIQDVFMFRDTDFDAMPNDYWTNDFGDNLNFKAITTNTPDATNLLTLWAFGINTFAQNLLN